MVCFPNRMFTVFLALAFAILSVHSVPTPLSNWQDGTASFFGAAPSSNAAAGLQMTIPSGSCGYGNLDPRLFPFYNVVGLHPTNQIVQERSQSACGSCLEVECIEPQSASPSRCHQRSSPLQVVITDQCDKDCNSTNVNMHMFSFEQLAPLRFGRINIRYRLVTCEPADPIVVHIQNYRATQGGWIRLAFKNVAGDGAITAVELAPTGTDHYLAPRLLNATSPWVPMLNTFGAMWEASAFPAPPLDLRITDSVGELIVIKNAIAMEGILGDVETTAVPNFPASGNATASNATGSGMMLEAGSKLLLPADMVAVGAALPQPPQVAAAAQRRQAEIQKAALDRVAAKAAGRRHLQSMV